MTRDDTTRTAASAEIARLTEEIELSKASNAKVLITGDGDVRKDLIAHAIHHGSVRSMHPFVPIKCATLTETIFGSELENADRGTVFLDEADGMTPAVQALLLQFLETSVIQSAGSNGATRRVDVRVIAAADRNLPDLVLSGTFLEDLFYRLNVIHIVVPPEIGSVRFPST
jgi:transcriptional regulator with PAS, ATPase and Fis domain